MKKKALLSLCFFLCFNTLYAETQSVKPENYFSQLENLKSEENWEKIVADGEKALKIAVKNKEFGQQFLIRDQLVSTYFRLGKYDKAKKHAEQLLPIGLKLNQPAAVVDSFYKLSASLRGKANACEESRTKRRLFEQARMYAQKALDVCSQSCPDCDSLKARVLYNYAAAHCDDQKGDTLLGIAFYKQALELFNKENESDYVHRTSIRLAKAELNRKNVQTCREIVETLKKEILEKRTHMHLAYLEAFLLKEEGNIEESLLAAKEGKEEAVQLNAAADLKRFESFISSFSN